MKSRLIGADIIHALENVDFTVIWPVSSELDEYVIIDSQ